MNAKVLLIEDDQSLAQWIVEYLDFQGFIVLHIDDGLAAVAAVKEHKPDIVILDLMLPNTSGFEICCQLRSFYSQAILMLTASNEDNDEIRALEIGANDFVSKPVRPKVLLARINALLKRNEPNDDSVNLLEFGVLKLHRQDKLVELNSKTVNLSATEFDLLWLLTVNAGSVVSRDSLLKSQRGLEYDGLDRSVDIAISRLRKKLNDSQTPAQRIKTVRGKGYLFSPTAWNSN